MRIANLFGASIVFALSTVAHAERELTTDRPDVTESPFTVEPGRLQIESSLVEHSSDVDEGARVRELALATLAVRIGLGPSTEVQLLVDPWRQRHVRPAGAVSSERTDGFGDVTVRAKWTLLGDDDGPFAIALLPFVTFPTAAHDLGANGVDAGLSLPVAFSLPHDFDLGVMTEADVTRRDDGGRDLTWINTVTVGHPLSGALAGYAELTAETGQSAHRYGLDVGLTLTVGDDVQFDVGGNFGLNGAAEDRLLFAGLVRRF